MGTLQKGVLKRRKKTPRLLHLVLLFGHLGGLPLHVSGTIRAAAFERFDMVNDITRTSTGWFAGGRTRVAALEFVAGLSAAGDMAILVTLHAGHRLAAAAVAFDTWRSRRS